MTDAELDDMVRKTADRMLELDQWVSADFRITPEDAANMLKRSPGTLARWRGIPGHPLEFIPGKRPMYALRKVLKFAYSGYCEEEAA